MLILEPISKKRIWGTNRLREYSGDPNVDKVGSIYTMSATENMSNKILNGPFAGQSLYDVMKNNHSKFGLESGEEYPIMIAIHGADEHLSIQVHPTDDYAREHENALYGKSESWYFLEAPDDGWIYAGSQSADKETIREKVRNGQYEEVVGKIPVQEEDYVFIPSGTLHALTKGAIVLEIHQSTDITYRFYDYDRVDEDGNKRELHLDQAIETLETGLEPVKSSFSENLPIREKPYEIVRMVMEENYQNTKNIAQTLTVISGSLTVNGETINKGQSALLFPGEKISVQQSAEVIIATPNTYWRTNEQE